MDEKPRILISKCIEHGYCRYDQSQASSSFVRALKPYVSFITVCPEIAIGLKTPRDSIRIVNRNNVELLVSSVSGKDITDLMTKFSTEFSNDVKNMGLNGIIMKSKSPSCGTKDVKMFKGIGKMSVLPEKTRGHFGRVIVDNFKDIAVEDERRLTNFDIRNHFLTRIFISKRFEEVLETKRISSLVKFHSENKYLLMSYNQKNQKELGRIVANHNQYLVEDVINSYYKLVQKNVAKPLTRASNINMLMHVFGYFKQEISSSEKVNFIDVMEQYKTKKVPFSVPLAILHSFVVRFDNSYLKSQTIFNPYPIELLSVSDSGKGNRRL